MLAAGVIVAAFGGYSAYGSWQFQSAERQNQILQTYLPEVDCRKAAFQILEEEAAMADYRYVVRIANAPSCINGIKAALARRGAKPLAPEAAEQGIALPGHESTDKEAVLFDFDREPDAVIWTRDKT